MTPESASQEFAYRIGESAGRRFITTGIPSRNPMPETLLELASAWRRGYFRSLTLLPPVARSADVRM